MGGCQQGGVWKKIAPSFNSECKLMINGCVPRAPWSVGSVTQCARGRENSPGMNFNWPIYWGVKRNEGGWEVLPMHTFHICVRVKGVRCSLKFNGKMAIEFILLKANSHNGFIWILVTLYQELVKNWWLSRKINVTLTTSLIGAFLLTHEYMQTKCYKSLLKLLP